LGFSITEGFIKRSIHVDNVLGRITLHGKARSVQENTNDTNEIKTRGGKENAKQYKRSER
jgi:hypothetical protein